MLYDFPQPLLCRRFQLATEWKFHHIVDVNSVIQHVHVPMPEDVMIIDARPKRSKYDKGRIPMAVSIPDSQFFVVIRILLCKMSNGISLFR